MKCPVILSLSLITCLLLPTLADARIGESRSAFERRLFNNGGLMYRDKEERTNRRSGGPYSRYMEYLGASAEVRVYFKSDDGSRPSQSDLEQGTKKRDQKAGLGTGWEVHVLYVNDKSVLELYKRIGSMSEYEMNALLGLLGDGGFWEEAEPEQKEELATSNEEVEPPPTAFGFQYVRNDGKVRASKSGGGIMVFQKELDEFLARQHESRLIQGAPTSVQGF
ncbi:MAG: hypothetical protein ACPGSB_07320 [Opitutales bacterium]